MDLVTLLTLLDSARYGAVRWPEGRPASGRTWAACRRADWMLWFAARLRADRKLLVLAACDCAETALPLYERAHPKDTRPREAIRIARAWCLGRATLTEVRRAADATADATAYVADATAYAVYAAADAAYAAYADATAYAADATAHAAAHAAAAEAAEAAEAAADAAYAADATRGKALARMATLVRKRIPWAVMRDALATHEARRAD